MLHRISTYLISSLLLERSSRVLDLRRRDAVVPIHAMHLYILNVYGETRAQVGRSIVGGEALQGCDLSSTPSHVIGILLEAQVQPLLPHEVHDMRPFLASRISRGTISHGFRFDIPHLPGFS